ncbi:D-sedoheptulose-7-phosphate isomerase [Caldimonas sp. KR1-144]|uniref:D-sedoheptulose-7-phosphate isomerase n=1 Tax=Caldimonas sp. KR1-144 TaxID=3400911 RepID=UPI003C04BA7E
MSGAELFDRNLAAHQQVFAALGAMREAVALAGARLAQVIAEGGRLLLFGNGGSACDSLHIAAELSGRLRQERRALPAWSLSGDVGALTAIGNDYGYEQVFARQLQAHARRGDCAIALSTSGRSPNVLRALACAEELGLESIALLGRDGGPARTMARLALVVPHDDSARIQEAHIFIGHTWCGQIEQALGLVPAGGGRA